MIINEWHLLLLSIFPFFMFYIFRFLTLRSWKRVQRRLNELESKHQKDMADFANAVLREHTESESESISNQTTD